MRPLPSPVERLRVEIDGPVATLLIDNPAKRNALDLAMWRAIPALVAAIAAEPDVRVLLVRGAGDLSFAAGADIAEFETVRASAEGGRAYEAANVAAFDALARCPCPVVAVIRGFCLGGGLGLALACDLRLAEAGATFGVPAGRLGVGYPASAMAYVVAACGAQAAKDLVFTGRRIGAAEAAALGLVGRVVDPGALDAQAEALASGIAANAPLSLAAAKAAIDRAAGLPGAPDLARCEALAAACFDSDDYREGRSAFLAKRAPRFTGR